MKTGIRITTDFTGNYNHYYMQILNTEKYPKICGYIHWQGNKEDDGKNWYAISFTVNNGKHSDLLYMAKIAKLIEDNSYYNSQPDEIKQIIGGVEYFFSDNLPGLYPESKKGQKVFKVMKGEDHYATIIAPNELLAKKELEKNYKNGCTLIESGILS